MLCSSREKMLYNVHSDVKFVLCFAFLYASVQPRMLGFGCVRACVCVYVYVWSLDVCMCMCVCVCVCVYVLCVCVCVRACVCARSCFFLFVFRARHVQRLSKEMLTNSDLDVSVYFQSRTFRWCLIFGNFGADNFYR